MGPRSNQDAGRRATAALLDVLAVIYFAAFVGQVIDWRLLNLPTLPTGGDMASHVLYAWTTGTKFFPNGRLTGWMPEVFAGFPVLSYYFPLPFVVAAALAKLIGFGEGLKWATMLPSFLLPGVAYVIVRRVFRLHYLSALTAGFAVLACLVQDENAIWGGNLLGVLAGEFAYTYGELFALIAMAAWIKARESPRGWLIAGLFEALVGVSHGYPLLVTGFSTLTLFVLDRDVRRTFVLLLKGHALAFCLIAGWLWPMLEMHGYTVPNDGAVSISAWRELLPKALWPTALLGASGLGLWLLPVTRRRFPSMAARSVIYFASAAAIAAVGWLSADSIGLADIRFFPLVWLLGGIAAAIVFGESIVALTALARRPAATMVAPAVVAAILMLGQAAWLSADVSSIQTWAYWNYSGYENKPQWQNLSRLFPAMTGKIGSPRLVFEHDPANNDLGSTRSLEALPMFLGGRPVLEGLYMESALLAPEVYWLQSELSAKPSSPLGRFPSSALDPAAAARHMDWLYADTILLRSDEAKAAVAASGLFDLVAEAPPFALYRLRGPPPQLVVPVSGPLVPAPRDGWMENAYDWFRSTRGRAAPPLPYYPGAEQAPIASASKVMTGPEVTDIALDRDELRFTVSAIGLPYLVKMAFHDRWQLVTPGSLYLAAPGFMLVVPSERHVVLRYGTTWAGRMGEVASALAFLVLIVLLVRRQAQAVSRDPVAAPPRLGWRVAAWLAVLAGIGSALYVQSPNRAFGNGLEAMNRQRYTMAAEWFGRAAETRRGRARQEEALFWQAKATELAGNKAAALRAYTHLIGRFDGYWLPEALYTASVLADQVGDPVSARTWRERLVSAYPNDRWALHAREIAPQ